MGWSHVAAKEYRQALVPWQELAARDDNDTAALEARLAVPYAYAELGALGQSSRLYGDALAAFDREDQALTESIDAIQSGKLVDALLAENPGADMGWFWSIRSLPSMPHASHLAHVLAQHEFQEAFKNYRDLRFLTLNLEQWQAKLAIFEDMLDNRRSAYAARLPAITQQAGTVSVDAMQARRAELARQVAAADDSGTAYASARQQELLAKSSAAQQLIDRHPDDAEFSTAQQRVRLAQGTLLWQLAQDYPQRDWQAHRNLQSIAAMLDQARLLETALQQARHDEPARFDQFAQRIAALAEALNATLPRVAALTAEQQQAVQQIAVAELSHEKELLGQYATQAHFALAQLYDRLSEATTTPAAEADHARTP